MAVTKKYKKACEQGVFLTMWALLEMISYAILIMVMLNKLYNKLIYYKFKLNIIAQRTYCVIMWLCMLFFYPVLCT